MDFSSKLKKTAEENPHLRDGQDLFSDLGVVAKKRMRSSQYGEVDPSGRISRQADQSAGFGRRGRREYDSTGTRMRDTEDMLRRRAMGEDSLSAEQLRQGLQQNQTAQMSMAASARPGQGPMAARNAMMNASRMGAGLSGQQALAGIQERQQATNALGSMQMNRRAQELQQALQSQGQSLSALEALERARGQRYATEMGVPTVGEQALTGLLGLGNAYMMRK